MKYYLYEKVIRLFKDYKKIRYTFRYTDVISSFNLVLT